MSLRLALPLGLSRPSRPDPPSLKPVPATTPATVSKSNRRRSVWLAVHLQGWQLHSTLRRLKPDERAALAQKPLAVVDDDRRGTLLACNALALARGVRVGHSLNASIALCAEMQFLPRQPAAENEFLLQIAADCEKYTSFVSAEPPNELLLEVRGSFRLFGGIDGLLERICEDFKAREIPAQLALTPTPQSALWFSRVARKPIVVKPSDLIPTIAKLPVSYLIWPADLELRLARFGVLTIGDLLRLPRSGLARRIGYDRLAELDHAVGRHRQVRQSHRTAQSYKDRVLLDFEIETTGLLSTIIEARFRRLSEFLTKRTLATDRVQIDLKHRDQPITPVVIGLAAPTSDMSHITKLMHEQLARVQLPAPVVEALIRVERLQPQPEASRDFFERTSYSPATGNTEPQARLLEQLRSRLGEQGVRQLVRESDHRPECANEIQTAVVAERSTAGSLPPDLAPRPLWLLSAPRAIASSSRTWASIISGPEAVESGWWDGLPVHRDYFVARSSRGALAWLFQDRASSKTFVHGLFG